MKYLLLVIICVCSVPVLQAEDEIADQVELSADVQRTLLSMDRDLDKAKVAYRVATEKAVAKALKSLKRELIKQTKRGNEEELIALTAKIEEIQAYAPTDLFGAAIVPERLEEIVSVPSNGKSVVITHTGTLQVTPNPESVWNTSPTRWEDVGFLGHVGQFAQNGMAFMQLCYSLNGEKLVAITGPVKIKVNGEIYFAPSDLEGGGGIGNNTGSIELRVVKY